MGKSTKLLRIAVTDSAMLYWSEVLGLIEQGHSVTLAAEGYYLVLGPLVWRMNESLKPYFSSAVKAARIVKYGKKGEE